MKKLLIKIRSSLKFVILVSFATFLILATVILMYKPIYSVYLNDELVGYCANKSKLQKQISDYVENGNGDNDNLAYVSVDTMPTYRLCLLKRGITTNDEEIFEKIKSTGTSYYKYFAVLEKEDEKAYVATYKEAEEIVKKLKEKDSNNIKDIRIVEKYETDLKKFTSTNDAVTRLYEKKVVEVAKVQPTTSRGSNTVRSGNTGSVNGSSYHTTSTKKINLGITLRKPINGVVSSKFLSMLSIRNGAHTGLDIAAPSGTTIKAAAAGTVTFSGWWGGLGNLVIVSHGNGVQTYYGHCSKRYVKAGDKVAQGSKIAAVGSTGNSTGPHLHLEVRVNGVAYNPQHYLY